MSDSKEIVLKEPDSSSGKMVRRKPVKVALEEENFTEVL